MKNLKNLSRLLSTVLAVSLIIAGTNLTVFANESVDTEENVGMETNSTDDMENSSEETYSTDNEIVCISADGSISYETISTAPQEELSYSDDGIVMLNGTPSTSQSDDVMAFASSSGLQDVPLSFVGVEPYRNMCIITAQFPDGKPYDSSGILISKNLVLVSAHGVYNHEHGGAATTVDISIGAYFSGSKKLAQGGTQKWKGAYIQRQWVENQLSAYDWALVELSQNTITYEKCGYLADINNAKGKAIKIIGYPGIDGFGAAYFKYNTGEITGTPNIFSNEKYKNIWYLSTETSEGMSGGPIIGQSNGAVIGVIKGHIVSNGGALTPAGVPLTETAANVIIKHAVW